MTTTGAHAPQSPRSTARGAAATGGRVLRPGTSPRSPQLEGNPHGDGDPTQPKINAQINKAIF